MSSPARDSIASAASPSVVSSSDDGSWSRCDDDDDQQQREHESHSPVEAGEMVNEASDTIMSGAVGSVSSCVDQSHSRSDDENAATTAAKSDSTQHDDTNEEQQSDRSVVHDNGECDRERGVVAVDSSSLSACPFAAALLCLLLLLSASMRCSNRHWSRPAMITVAIPKCRSCNRQSSNRRRVSQR